MLHEPQIKKLATTTTALIIMILISTILRGRQDGEGNTRQRGGKAQAACGLPKLHTPPSPPLLACQESGDQRPQAGAQRPACDSVRQQNPGNNPDRSDLQAELCSTLLPGQLNSSFLDSRNLCAAWKRPRSPHTKFSVAFLDSTLQDYRCQALTRPCRCMWAGLARASP